MSEQDAIQTDDDTPRNTHLRKQFWALPLDALNDAEWEALCDGCAKCCLNKLEDEETGEILMTRVCCRYLDRTSGVCTVYPERVQKKPDCFVIERQDRDIQARHFSWLPETCAYRLRAEEKELYHWHPLLVQEREQSRLERAKARAAMMDCGIAVGEACISEAYVHEDDLVEFVIEE